MSHAYFRSYVPADRKIVLALNLRDADIRELEDSCGIGAREALRVSIDSSTKAWCIIVDDEVVGVFGVSPAHHGVGIGIPWMLGTDKLSMISYKFAKHSLGVVEMMLDEYPVLTNIVSIRHTDAVQWLKWLGFKFIGSPIEMKNNSLFQQFILERS